MGTELLNACIFCTATLFGRELSVPPGLGAEIGISYATLARTDDSAAPPVTSDVTGKFVLVGMGNARLPEGTLGAGTPDREWRLRFALAPSHDEQKGDTPAVGTGRYENYAFLYRLPIGGHDSLEAAANRRTHEATDQLFANHTFSENRDLSAERVELGLGWRHRWEGLEAAVTARLDHVGGSNGTPGAFYSSGGYVPGVGVEGRMRLKNWTLSLAAETVKGSIDVNEESAPQFLPRNSVLPVSLQSVRLGVNLSLGHREAALSVSYERSRLPFVSLAVLSTETAAFQAGFHPESRTQEWIVNVSAGHWIAPRVRTRVFLRASYGKETLTLTDALGEMRPTQTLPIRRGGVFGSWGLSSGLGSPEIVLGFASDFSLSAAGR
ncbi:MAG: hypothetical protein ACRD1B_08110 [Thermoanaerobaculia bacterium]